MNSTNANYWKVKSEIFKFRIAQHKTAEKAPALALLTAKEEKALTSFVKHYRPIVSPCTEKDCYAFSNSPVLRPARAVQS